MEQCCQILSTGRGENQTNRIIYTSFYLQRVTVYYGYYVVTHLLTASVRLLTYGRTVGERVFALLGKDSLRHPKLRWQTLSCLTGSVCTKRSLTI